MHKNLIDHIRPTKRKVWLAVFLLAIYFALAFFCSIMILDATPERICAPTLESFIDKSLILLFSNPLFIALCFVIAYALSLILIYFLSLRKK